MAALWLKFSEETSLPNSLTVQEQELLNNLFDYQNSNSMWRKAAEALGLPVDRTNTLELIRWHKGVPYIHWSGVVEIISSGWLEVVPTPDGGFVYKARTKISDLPKLIKSQWKIEAYLQRKQIKNAPLPETLEEKLCESTALGLALLALTLRLPKHDPKHLAQWLANPQSAPFSIRKNILRIQAVQVRRTLLSSAWIELFPDRSIPKSEIESPLHFWDEPPIESVITRNTNTASAVSSALRWDGLPVCSGIVTGRAVLIRLHETHTFEMYKNEPLILIFSQARPETTDFFQHAGALLFAEGGVLSHACSVAREQGIPCITGLGQSFLHDIQNVRKNRGNVWLSMDASQGMVELIQQQ